MEIAPAGVQCPFEVTYDSPSLAVAMSVYDVTTGSPVLVQGPTAMANVVGNTYFGHFTPVQGHQYVIFKAVYVNNSFLSLSTNYSQGSESIIAQTIPQGTSNSVGCSVVGLVDTINPVIGVVQC